MMTLYLEWPGCTQSSRSWKTFMSTSFATSTRRQSGWNRMSEHTDDGSLGLQSELPKATVKLHPRYSKLLRCLPLVSTGVPHGLFDSLPLKGTEIRAAQPHRIPPEMQR